MSFTHHHTDQPPTMPRALGSYAAIVLLNIATAN